MTWGRRGVRVRMRKEEEAREGMTFSVEEATT